MVFGTEGVLLPVVAAEVEELWLQLHSKWRSHCVGDEFLARVHCKFNVSLD